MSEQLVCSQCEKPIEGEPALHLPHIGITLCEECKQRWDEIELRACEKDMF